MNQSCNLFKKTVSNFIVLLTAVITMIVLSIITLVKIIKISIECLLDYFVQGAVKNERD